MVTLEEIIQREVNPFDPVTFKTGNFWTEDKQVFAPTVDSIHQEAITEIHKILDSVAKDHLTRSVLVTGDSGCGKSHLLSRLKKLLNPKAFFAYIDPPPSSDCIWRHALRYTVDSLMHVPEGNTQSQLLLWLKNLSVFKDHSWKKRLLGEKRVFIQELRNAFPTDIYQAKDFFAVLYELTQKNYLLACDWLRGDNLDIEELKILGVNSVIDTEEVARGVLGNFGRISSSNQPIVLCFDQVELAPRLPDGSYDINYVFNISTALHNNNLKNFLVIISIIRDKLMANKTNIPQSDLARIEKIISLKAITLEQVEALWASRLHFLHSQVDPKPESPIAPLNRQRLEEKYPGGKANLRDSLNFGGELYLEYIKRPKPDPLSSFKLLWREELNKTQASVSRIRQFSSQELIEMFQQTAIACQVKKRISPFSSGKYASYSFSYSLPNSSETTNVIWFEEPNLTAFFHVMSACDRLIKENPSTSLIIIRSEKLGHYKNQGFKLYQQIFQNSFHRHLIPNLDSLHYLKTYQKLANDALVGDLVISFKTPSLEELQSLVLQAKVLEECCLLNDLGIISSTPNSEDNSKFPKNPLQEVKELILDIVKNQQFLGLQILILLTKRRYSHVGNIQIEPLIQELCREKKMKILDPNVNPEEQLICYIPQN